jgi:penicillin-binding protein 1A
LFIGFAQDLVVGVWVGNDDNTPLAGQIAGGGLPARIWRDFMSQAIGTGPARVLAPPLQAPVGTEGLNGSLTLPIEGTGYEVGVQVDENGVTISAQPGDEPPADEPPSERPVAAITPPPAPPPPDDVPPEDER